MVYYRYANPSEFEDNGSKKNFNLQEILDHVKNYPLDNLPVEEQRNLNKFLAFFEKSISNLDFDLSLINISLKGLNYVINSSERRLIDLNEYLSETKGKGGQIAGFLNFISEENRLYWTLNFDFLSDGNRKLILFNHKNDFSNITESKVTIEKVNVDLNSVVAPEKGKIKVFEAGKLMGEKSNITEVNMVGDCELKGYEVIIDMDFEKMIDYQLNYYQSLNTRDSREIKIKISSLKKNKDIISMNFKNKLKKEENKINYLFFYALKYTNLM